MRSDLGRRLARPRRALALLVVAAALAGCATANPAMTPIAAAPVTRSIDAKAAVQAGESALDDGLYQEALRAFRSALSADPTDQRAQLGSAEAHLALGDAGEARTLFESLIAVPELRARGLQGKGLALLKLGQRDTAGKALAEAVAADATLWRAWNALAMIDDTNRRYDEARAKYAKALALRPEAALLHNNLGFSQLQQGDAPAAVETLRKALEMEPGNEVIQSNLRIALAAQGRYQEALAATARKKLPSVLNNLGYVAMMRGDYDVAGGYLARALEASPSYNETAANNLLQLKALASAPGAPAKP
jgi:Flp pilus assembly protein TadD